MKTLLLDKNSIETTNSVTCLECEQVLELFDLQLQKDTLFLDYIEFGEVGFERKSDWMRLVNKLNSYNHDQLLNRFFKDSNKFELDNDVYLELVDRIDGTIQVIFENGQKIIVGETKDSYIIFEATKIQGTISWEWYPTNNNNLDHCNALEVILTNVEIIK